MPIFDYRCDNNHTTEKLFKSFKAADEMGAFIDCPECGGQAVRQHGVPSSAHFHGNPDGYYKPSPAKRFSYSHSTAKGNDVKRSNG